MTEFEAALMKLLNAHQAHLDNDELIASLEWAIQALKSQATAARE